MPIKMIHAGEESGLPHPSWPDVAGRHWRIEAMPSQSYIEPAPCYLPSTGDWLSGVLYLALLVHLRADQPEPQTRALNAAKEKLEKFAEPMDITDLA